MKLATHFFSSDRCFLALKGVAPLEGENGDTACRHSTPQDSKGGPASPSRASAQLPFILRNRKTSRALSSNWALLVPLLPRSLSEKLSSPRNNSVHLPQESLVLLSLLLYGTVLWPFGGVFSKVEWVYLCFSYRRFPSAGWFTTAAFTDWLFESGMRF